MTAIEDYPEAIKCEVYEGLCPIKMTPIVNAHGMLVGWEFDWSDADPPATIPCVSPTKGKSA